MLNTKNMALITILASSLHMAACQPVDKNKDQMPAKVDQTAISEAVVEAPRLIGTTQRVPVMVEPCRGNGCPEMTIDRLSTNQPELDRIIDQAILKHLQSTIEIDEANALDQDAVSAADAQASVSSPTASKTSAQLLAEQLQPYVNNFLKLDDELKTLGVNHQISFTVSPKILNAQAPLATVVINSSHYLGGAHGSSAQHYYNYDLEKRSLVELGQLIQPKQQAQFKQLAYAAFKTWVIDNKLADNVQAYEQAWTFELSQNYYLGQQGLILQYQEYEIGPYVVGLPRLILPYDQLQNLLKPEYLPETFKPKSASEAATSEQGVAQSNTVNSGVTSSGAENPRTMDQVKQP